MNDIQRVLEHYGLSGAFVRAIENTDNTNHAMTAPNGDLFLLRQHRPDRHDTATLEFEIVWLHHLRSQGLEVQEPVALRTGGYILVEGSKRYSLLTWLEGEVVESLDATQSEAAGVTVARLHLAARAFKAPPGFVRPRYDIDHFGRSTKQDSKHPVVEPRFRCARARDGQRPARISRP